MEAEAIEMLRNLLKKRIFVVLTEIMLVIALLSLSFVIVANTIVLSATKKHTITALEATSLGDIDCIIVLGCGLRADGSPSDMLTDRLLVGIDLYQAGASKKILMSGDHGQVDYDEVGAMKNFAMSNGVPDIDIFMDHAGFSTYESIYRAKEIFGADKIIVVTQGYHLPRALYIAKALGIEAYGVSANLRSYRGQLIRDTRELLARSKDLLYTITKPLPTYLGEPVSLNTDGNVTNG